MKTAQIPNGTATIRERRDIKVRHEQAIEAATMVAAPAFAKIQASGGMRVDDDPETTLATLAAAKLTLEEVEAVQGLARTKIFAGLVDWTRPEPLPTPATIGDLDGPTYEALVAATGDIDTEGKVDFNPSDPKSPGFEESPTSPSGVSEDGLRADRESESITAPSSSGTSTDSGASSRDSAMTTI